MIPDFFDLRRELEEEASLYLHLRQRTAPILGETQTRTQHEGKAHSYMQTGFGIREGAPKAFSATIEFSQEEMTGLVGEALINKLNSLANDMIRQLTTSLFEVVSQETLKSGANIDAKGQPLDAEMLLEMLRRVQMDFDEYRRPRQKFYVAEEMAKTLGAKAKAWEADHDLQRRQKQLMVDKYEEFRVRESSRKLVS